MNMVYQIRSHFVQRKFFQMVYDEIDNEFEMDY